MTCPHCLLEFHQNWLHHARFASDRDGGWNTVSTICPACDRVVIHLRVSDGGNNELKKFMVYPKAGSRAPLSASVPEEFAADYREACLVLTDSPKASAALSRRCLQHVLREVGGFKAHNLDTEIQNAIDSKTLPSY